MAFLFHARLRGTDGAVVQVQVCASLVTDMLDSAAARVPAPLSVAQAASG